MSTGENSIKFQQKKKRGWFKSYNWKYTINVSTSFIYKTVVLFSMINTTLIVYMS